uniref:Ycf2 n=1 Tax=Crepidomanes latealatum TaxID=164669 RepID=UPI0023D7FE3B|nr:Ycf2 [Crepidomanes latealatum]WDE75834.1 Ycf2 [Crepidomanes latealatum]
MKKESNLSEVGEKRVRDSSSLFGFLGLIQTNRSYSFFTSLENPSQKRSLIDMLYVFEPFIRLFDLRILNPLLLRDLRNIIEQYNRLIVVILFVLALPISMYHSSKTDLFKRSDNILTDSLSFQDIGLREERYKDSVFLSIKNLFTLWNIKRYPKCSDFTAKPLSLLDDPLLFFITTGIKHDSKNLFQDYKPLNLFFESLRLYSPGNPKEALIPNIYPKIRYESINRLTQLILVSNRLKLIPKEIIIQRTESSSLFWSQFNHIIYPIYSFLRLYEQDRITSFCLVYLLFLYDCFWTCLFRLRYQSLNWTEGNRYIHVMRLLTQDDLVDWKERIRYLFNRFIVVQIDGIHKYTRVQLIIHRSLNISKSEDSSLSSFGKMFMRFKSDSNRSIAYMSKISDRLLDHIGIWRSNLNSKYSPKFSNESFFLRVILYRIIPNPKDVLINIVNSLLLKLKRRRLLLPKFFFKFFTIDKGRYIFKEVLNRNDNLLFEFESLQDRSLFLDGLDSEIYSQNDKKSQSRDHSNIYSSIFNTSIIRRGSYLGSCSNSYFNVLYCSFISFQNREAISSSLLLRDLGECKVLSFIQSQGRDLLFSELSQIIQELTNNGLTSSLKRGYKALIYLQSYFYFQDKIGSLDSKKDISISVNNLIENESYATDFNLSTVYRCEPEIPEMPYWLKRLSLHRSIASGLVTRSQSLYKDTIFRDINTYISDEPSRTSYIVNFNQLLSYLNTYRTHFIFSRDETYQKWNLFKEYIPWFFTSNWWQYFYDLIIHTYPETLLNLRDKANSSSLKVSDKITNFIADLMSDLRLRIKIDFINRILARLDLAVIEEITNQSKTICSLWSRLRCLNKPTLSYSILLLVIFILLIKNYLSTALGFDSFHLWNHFRTIRYLIDPMRGFYLKRVIYSPSTRKMQTRFLVIHSFKRFLNYINNIFFYLFLKNGLDLWILERSSFDTLRIKKQLLTQYLVTNKTMSKYVSGSSINDLDLLRKSNNNSFLQEGFHLLSYLPQFCQKDLLNYRTRKINITEKWVLSALAKSILFPGVVRPKGISNISYNTIPIPFLSGLLPMKGILLVGPIEAGRSLIIRNIASNSSLPLIKISLRKFLYNRSFLINIRGRFISKQSVHRLNLIFEIAKELSPCIIWIQDIHELNVYRFYNRLEANPRFLLCLLLKRIGNDHTKSCSLENLVIALTHLPRKLDPALIAPNRLNQLINFRRPTRRQRRRYLSMLLHIKGFEGEDGSSLLETMDSITMGYNKRDVSYFANGALLIKNFRKSQDIIYTDAIQLALHRQNSIINNIANQNKSSLGKEIVSYNIAKSFLKNSFLKIPFTDLSFFNSNIFRKKFYYLHNWYLEPFSIESTFNELSILPYILFLLAGLAARDCWFKMDMTKKENLLGIHKAEENDFNLACGILEILSKDFFCSEINRGVGEKKSLPFVSLIDRNCSLSISIIASSYGSKPAKQDVSNIKKRPVRINSIITGAIHEIYWSPKSWHLSFRRSYNFEFVKTLSEPNSLGDILLFYQDQGQIPQRDFDLNKIKNKQRSLYKENKYSFSYRRSLGNLRKREIKRLENQLDNILLRERFLGLGISELFNQYKTQSNPLSFQSIVFLGKQFVWDPVVSTYVDYNILSLYRNLIVKEELVRRLYITYGVRREREKHLSNEKIKSFFIHRGYDRRSITDLSVNRWNNSPLGEEQHLEYNNIIQSMHINLQYPQLFVPIHLYQSILIEDFQERFINSSILIYRERWLKWNNLFSGYFLTYNMLFESYEYLARLSRSRFNRSAMDAAMESI